MADFVRRYLYYVVVGPGSKDDANCKWKPTFRK